MDHSETSPQPRASRAIPRQTLGGLSLLLVVALTFGAARSGAIVNASRDAGTERAAAVMPKAVHHAQRRHQREKSDVRVASGAVSGRADRSTPEVPPFRESIEPVEPLRAGLIDLPPPVRG